MSKLAVVLVLLLALALVFGTFGCTKTVYVTPTPTPTPAPTPTPTPTPAPTPTPTPTAAPTPTPTPIPTATPPPEDPTVPPCQFRGTVKLNGVVVPNGTQVRAFVEGYVYTTTTPAEAAYGPSSYKILIRNPQGVSYEGKTVTFMIGNYVAVETSTWERGLNKVVNLNASTTP